LRKDVDDCTFRAAIVDSDQHVHVARVDASVFDEESK